MSDDHTIRTAIVGETVAGLLASLLREPLHSKLSRRLARIPGELVIAWALPATAFVLGCLDDLTTPQRELVIEATAAYSDRIFTAPLGSLVPLACRVLNGNGYPVPVEVTVTASSGVVAGSHCSEVRVQHSGLDTLHVAAGSAATTLPVAVAVPAVVDLALGDSLQVDRLPLGQPWAPTLRRNSRGQLELYFASLVTGTATGDYEDLHRLVSDDSVHFRYDGVVLRHDSAGCSLTGSGFENLAGVPRQEALGWRMFVAGGSFSCYDWQVFSAVSTDERTWTLEPGIRVGSESDSAMDNAYPTGEGIVVDQLLSGGWRMLNGAYGHAPPDAGRFEIIEWDSPDQLNWTYVGPILTTQQMPALGDENVYSPTIRQIAPGLWRMIFTGDNRSSPGGRSRLWSAVSIDLKNWQVEGQLMGSNSTNLYYSSLEGNRLGFIRWDDGAQRRLALATVSMP